MIHVGAEGHFGGESYDRALSWPIKRGKCIPSFQSWWAILQKGLLQAEDDFEYSGFSHSQQDAPTGLLHSLMHINIKPASVSCNMCVVHKNSKLQVVVRNGKLLTSMLWIMSDTLRTQHCNSLVQAPSRPTGMKQQHQNRHLAFSPKTKML